MELTQEITKKQANTAILQQQIKLLAACIGLSGLFFFGLTLPQWYFVGMSVALLVAALARWPMLGLVAMTLTVAFINLEVHWSPSFFSGVDLNVPIVDLVALLTFIAGSLRLFFGKERQAAVRALHVMRRQYRVPMFWFGVFLGVALLSTINAPEPLAAIKYILRPLLWFVAMYLVIPMAIITDRRRMSVMLATFVFVGFAVTAMGLASLYGQHDVAVRRVVPIAIAGVFPMGTNHNQIAEVLLATLPMMLLWAAYTLRQDNHRGYRLVILTMLPVAFTLLATLSRAGAIGLAVEAVVLLALVVRPKPRQVVIGATLIGALLLPFAGSFIRLAKAEAGQSANENRLLLTETALTMWQEHPWIGNGIGSFVPLLALDRRYTAKFGEPLDAHGIIQKLLPETGLFGLVTFGLFWVSLLQMFWRKYAEARAHSKLEPRTYNLEPSAFWLALFLGTSAFQLFGTSYFIGRFWLPVGVGLAAMAMSTRGQKLSNSVIQ